MPRARETSCATGRPPPDPVPDVATPPPQAATAAAPDIATQCRNLTYEVPMLRSAAGGRGGRCERGREGTRDLLAVGWAACPPGDDAVWAYERRSAGRQPVGVGERLRVDDVHGRPGRGPVVDAG